MNPTFSSIFIKSYKYSKFSVLMLVMSLLIATCGLSSVLIINNSAKQSYSSENTMLLGTIRYQIVPRSSAGELNKSDYALLRKQGFSNLIAIAQQPAHLYAGEQKLSQRPVTVSGIDTLSLLETLQQAENQIANGNEPLSAEFASITFNEPMGVAHTTLVTTLSSVSKDGPRPHLRISSANGIKKLTLPNIRPVEEPSLGNDILVDISLFYTLFPDKPLSRLVYVDSDPSASEINRLVETLPSHLTLETTKTEDEKGELTESFHLNLMAMALLMFVVCLFIVLNAVNLLVNSRLPWFKICRQLGISRQTIFISQIAEITIITLMVSLLGIFCSIYVSNLVAPSVQATLEGLYGVEVGFGKVSLLSLFLQVFSISLFGSLAATVVPFMQTNRSLAKRHEINESNNHTLSKSIFWLAFFFFGSAALILLAMATSLGLLLLATALLILSGCSLLIASYPFLLKAIDALIPRRFVLLKLTMSRSISLSRKTKVACCAFFIAVTSNVGMNLMVDSFRNATLSWLDTRLVAPYYLYYEGKEDIQSLAQDLDLKITQRFENQTQYKDLAIQQFSYPSSDEFKQAMVFEKHLELESAWFQFAQGQGVFVNQQFANHFDITLDDQILLDHPETKSQESFTILGIVYDYGNPYKQVLLHNSLFNSTISSSRIYAISGNEDAVDKFRERLSDAGVNSDDMLLPTEQLLAISMRTFNRTFLITDGLNLVTLLVAALSLACAIVVLMKDARPQSMLIRSLGVSQITTMVLSLFQYLMLCIVALALATPFGILLSWVLIYKINLQAFQWTYPLQVEVINLLSIYGLSLVVVCLIIVLPIFKASRRPLIEDIRCVN